VNTRNGRHDVDKSRLYCEHDASERETESEVTQLSVKRFTRMSIENDVPSASVLTML
jgi:hypothetical protein